jgi:hypothetical protein
VDNNENDINQSTEQPNTGETPEPTIGDPILDTPEFASLEQTADTTPTEAVSPEDAPTEDAPTDDTPAEDNFTDETDAPLPPHFEPIPAEKLKRAKRTKIVLIVIIILLILALAGMGATAVYVFINQESNSKTIENPVLDIAVKDQETRVQDKGTLQATEAPNLVQMFGKTSAEVQTLLGPNYTLVKTEPLTEPENPAIVQLTTFAYSPSEKPTSAGVGSSLAQNIYLSLNAEGQTIEVYFVSSIDLLGYPISTFAELTGNKSPLENAILAAGAVVSPDFVYQAPVAQQFAQYVDTEATNKRVKKETFSFTGALQSEAAPTSFTLTFTYDYGAAGVADTPDKKPTQRTLYLTLK